MTFFVYLLIFYFIQTGQQPDLLAYDDPGEGMAYALYDFQGQTVLELSVKKVREI